jgi:hypothetical protein
MLKSSMCLTQAFGGNSACTHSNLVRTKHATLPRTRITYMGGQGQVILRFDTTGLSITVVSGGWNGPTQFPDSIRGPLGYQPRALPSELGRSPYMSGVSILRLVEQSHFFQPLLQPWRLHSSATRIRATTSCSRPSHPHSSLPGFWLGHQRLLHRGRRHRRLQRRGLLRRHLLPKGLWRARDRQGHERYGVANSTASHNFQWLPHATHMGSMSLTGTSRRLRVFARKSRPFSLSWTIFRMCCGIWTTLLHPR